MLFAEFTLAIGYNVNLATNVLLHFAIFHLSLLTRLTDSSLRVSKPKQ